MLRVLGLVLLAACATNEPKEDGDPAGHLYTDKDLDAAYHASVAGLQANGYEIVAADAVARTVEAKSDRGVARIQVDTRDGRTRVHLMLAARDGTLVEAPAPYQQVIHRIQEALK